MTAGVCGVLVEALGGKLTEELGWDWKGERFEDVCMRGGPMDVPSGEQVIRELAEALASVVAALPNIAVIELPEGENNWHITDWDTGRVSLCHGVDTVRCYLPNPELETAEAEQLGIALIAASRVLAAAHGPRR